MKVLVSAIEWDIDGSATEELALPVELTVDTAAERIGDHAQLCDWLSDKHGWTVRSFSCNPPLSDANVGNHAA